MIKILEGKLASAQKDAFSIQENSSKKDSEIMSLKAELEHIKSKLVVSENMRGIRTMQANYQRQCSIKA